jgi:hypothetical protein
MDLSASRSLELLNHLQQAVGAAKTAEETLRGELRTKAFNAERRYQQAMRVVEDRVAAELTATQGQCQEMDDQVQRTHLSRVERLTKLRNTTQRNLSSMAQKEREKFLGRLQVQEINLDRKHGQDLNHLNSTFNDEVAELKEREALLLKQERMARSYLGGVGSFLAGLRRRDSDHQIPKHVQVLTELDGLLQQAEKQLIEFHQLPLPRLFSIVTLPIALVLCLILAAGAAFAVGHPPPSINLGIAVAVGLFLLVLLLYFTAKSQGSAQAAAIGQTLMTARRLYHGGLTNSEARLNGDSDRTTSTFDAAKLHLKQQWDNAGTVQADFEQRIRTKMATRMPWPSNGTTPSSTRSCASSRQCSVNATSSCKTLPMWSAGSTRQCWMPIRRSSSRKSLPHWPRSPMPGTATWCQPIGNCLI